MAATYRTKTLIQASFWLSAIVVGLVGILFDQLIHYAQTLYSIIDHQSPLVTFITTPLLFVVATGLVVKLAPNANGSGIPQAHKAMMISLGSHQSAIKSGLISIKTAFVKILSAVVGILAGASIGREGPTVQVSAAIFAWVGEKTKKRFPHIDFHSYLVAGAAAGVSAAFNTPLAGISFALEEMAENSFTQIKQTVMISVIIAGITTQAILGHYVYFGSPELPAPGIEIIFPAMIIGLTGGVAGSLFARMLIYPIKHPFSMKWWKIALICGALCSLINYLTETQSAGTGYEITRQFMNSENGEVSYWIPLAKLLTTVLSYLSGMAGGIFSPSLSIGAGLGASFGNLLPFGDPKTFALIGMVAFFTGAVQAPLTGVIIVMEMTDLHVLILPLMIAAFVSQGISKVFMPVSLYHYLAHHRPIRGSKKTQKRAK